MFVCVQFHRRVSGVSQYCDYLDYVQEIGQAMGFKVQRDTLRIPSSKRVRLFILIPIFYILILD